MSTINTSKAAIIACSIGTVSLFNFASGSINPLNETVIGHRYMSLPEPKKPKRLQSNNTPYYRRYEAVFLCLLAATAATKR